MAPESITITDRTPTPPQQPTTESQSASAAAQIEPAITTSPEEWEAFHTVRAILRGVVPAKRIFMRDAQSYCAILLDDNNRKAICRLRFNNTQKLRLGVFNDEREESLVELDAVEDIFNYTEQIKATATSYLLPSNGKDSEA